MNHEAWREHVALHVYGELDEPEQRALLAHLGGCAACRGLERELRTTLVSTAAPANARAGANFGDSADLDLALQRLCAHAHPPARPRVGSSFWVGLGLGAAAGIVGVWLALALPASGRHGAPNSATLASSWERSSPPPLARSGGEVALLGRYLRR